MSVQQILGISFLTFGLVSVSSYIENLSSLRIAWLYKELKPMQERWGKTAGTIMHIAGYTLAPIGFGILFLMGIVFPS